MRVAGSGAASGGTVNLNSSLLNGLDNSVGGSIGSLTISHGVKVVDSLNSLSISGSLDNYGSILTASSTKGATDTISAGTILNASGGAIGSYSGGGGGLFAADPSLTAANSIANNGAITSAGNLTISAPVVNNIAGHNPGASQTPVMTAAQNVNISTQNLNNSGLISALNGNVNVASSTSLNVANAGGTIQGLSRL